MIIIKRTILLAFVYLLLICSPAFAVPVHVVTDYHAVFLAGYNSQDKLRIAIRSYNTDNIPYYLVVNPENFTTDVIPAADFKTGATSKHDVSATKQTLATTPYIKALDDYSKPPYKLANYGMTHAEADTNGYFLTVDMCQSKKTFEKAFFQKLAAIADKTKQPFPVAISMTGLWMAEHPNEFDWLIEQQRAGKLDITWTNHSFTHPYIRGVKPENNFLLVSGTNIEQEILLTEKALLEHGELPSIFFRFPGLISDKKLVLALKRFGLIPIGSNAWLAKDQKPKPGSFILVHGNSNEHQGIIMVMPLLNNPDNQWHAINKEAFITHSQHNQPSAPGNK